MIPTPSQSPVDEPIPAERPTPPPTAAIGVPWPSAALRPTRRWRLAPPPRDDLVRGLPGVHPVVVRALAARGIADSAAARTFLGRAAGDGDGDPFRLAGMHAAVARLRQAIRDGEPIAVYGDYDADGVTATALLTEALTTVGAARVIHFIPHRERDGYGVHAHALAALAGQGARVVVTVDCGIRAGPEIAAAASQGLDVIVTDHHVLPEALPQAAAVINPRRPDCRYGFVDLAGVGLAYKLAQALLRVEQRVGRTGTSSAAATSTRRGGGPGGDGLDASHLLDLAAIGTVADMVPLRGENRAIVHAGLERLRSSPRPGVRAMLAAADVRPGAITARDLGFILGPRINAAGRVDDARSALELLLTREEATAARLAGQLEQQNRARRAAQVKAVEEAEARLGAHPGERSFILDVSTDVPLGVVGLVAGRLADRHYRPAAVLRLDGDVARGSARSIPEFDIVAALDRSADLLVKHGGHARAAGFTVRRADIPALEARLADLADAALAGVDLRPTLDVAAEVGPEDVGWPLCDALEALEPCGEGNPTPFLLWRDARVVARRRMGSDSQHLKLTLAIPEVAGGPTTDFQAARTVDAVAFGRGADSGAIGDRVDLVFTLSAGEWQGERRLELKVEDMAAPGSDG